MGKNIIGIIGGGNMGEALIKGLVQKKLFSVLVCESDAKRAKNLKDKYRVGLGDLNTVVMRSSIVIFAVKPQDMETVLSQITGAEDQLFITIAAGLTTKFFEKHLGGKPRVVRAMPNMPALIGEGITAICAGSYANSAHLEEAQNVLEAIGQVVIVRESMIDAVTAVSGSGPAYVFLFVEYWIAAAISLGLSENDAKELVWATLIGSAHLVRNLDARELRERVTSKGGTTEAAIKIFEENNFGNLMKDALAAAKNRAKELAE